VFYSWVINPRDVGSFPIASTIAASYNKYSITSLRIRYSPKCSAFTNGGILLGFSKDSSDPVPGTKYDLFNMQQRAEIAAKSPCILTCAGDNNVRFLRDTDSDDSKLVDYGRVVLCVYGNSSTDPEQLGELFFEYTVRLLEPQTNINQTQSVTVTGGSARGPNFATVTSDDAATTWLFNSTGRFLVTYNMTIPTSTTPSSTGTTSLSNTCETGDTCVGFFIVSADSPGATVTFAVSAVPEVLIWYAVRA